MPQARVLILITCMLLGLLLVEGWLAFAHPGHRRGHRRLRALAARAGGGETSAPIDIIRHRRLSAIPWVNDFLVRLPPMRALGRLLEQANSPRSAGTFLLLALFLCCGGLLVLPLVFHNPPMRWVGTAGLGITPFIYLSRRKQQRLRQFERQL